MVTRFLYLLKTNFYHINNIHHSRASNNNTNSVLRVLFVCHQQCTHFIAIALWAPIVGVQGSVDTRMHMGSVHGSNLAYSIEAIRITG